MDPLRCPRCEHEFTASAEPESPRPDGDLSVQLDTRNHAAGTARRRRLTTRGLLIRGGVLVLLAGAAVGAGKLMLFAWPQPERPQKPITIRPPGPTRTAGRPNLPRVLDALEHAVVKIESVDAGGDKGLGSGFVIDESGLVATSFHVLSEATQARVRFKDGSSFDIQGYVAVEPRNDLAIVKLRTTPHKLTAMRLADANPRVLSSVIAVGHPHGLAFSPYDGKVSRVLESADLPAESRRFLGRKLNNRDNLTWIQHTARISPGNSGGPLLNEAGQVIGVNSWVDERANFGYAVHVRHLNKLQSQARTAVQPLHQHARPSRRSQEVLKRLTAERANDLYAKAEAIQFHPSSADDYGLLQQLAWTVTAANLPGSFRPDPELEKQLDQLTSAADRITARLRKRRWGGPGQIIVVNEYAAQHLKRPLAGQFFFGTLERIVSGPRQSRGALIRLSGLEQTVFVPLDGDLFTAEPGESLLVLGVNQHGRTVRYGPNPLALEVAPIIASRTLLRLGEAP